MDFGFTLKPSHRIDRTIALSPRSIGSQRRDLTLDARGSWARRSWVRSPLATQDPRSGRWVRPGDLAADHPEPLVLGGEPLAAEPGVLCSSCNARKGLSQRRR
jgi:hypothetical protein